MAKAVKKKTKAPKKSAKMTAKAKVVASSAKTAKKKPAKAARKKAAPSRIDALNSANYRSVTPLLAVTDMRRAIDFYTSALGFKTKAVMDSPQGIVHAELTLRDTTLMLSPESRQQGSLSANSIGNTPVTLYVMVEDADQVFAGAVAGGGTALMPVMDMFWGDRCGMIADPEGNKWMIATHKSEPTEAEMQKAMREMMAQGQQSAAAAGH